MERVAPLAPNTLTADEMAGHQHLQVAGCGGSAPQQLAALVGEGHQLLHSLLRGRSSGTRCELLG
eukprot:5784160-Alexandrium_andersonii.AAC.1